VCVEDDIFSARGELPFAGLGRPWVRARQTGSMTGGQGTAVAVSFLWLGMVLAISFLEAPLKFRAPGVDLRLGLGIGRIVFRALNAVEVGLAAAAVAAMTFGDVTDEVRQTTWIPVAVLAVQLAAIRPALTKRSDRVFAGEEAGSKVHLIYIGAEVVKVAVLVTLGVLGLKTA